jgi:hypothetical protein
VKDLSRGFPKVFEKNKEKTHPVFCRMSFFGRFVSPDLVAVFEPDPFTIHASRIAGMRHAWKHPPDKLSLAR